MTAARPAQVGGDRSPAARARRARASAPRARSATASAGRAAALAAALALAPLLPRDEPTTEEWLAIGLVVALLGLVGLAVVVLALAREVGMLRLSVAPRGALEVAHEGPEVGALQRARGRLRRARPGQLGLAVFTSEGCGLCRVLAPAIDALRRAPARRRCARSTRSSDADAWAAADVPGSPFAVALDVDGTVLAKGTFNTGAQLESVLAAAERRRGAVRA